MTLQAFDYHAFIVELIPMVAEAKAFDAKDRHGAHHWARRLHEFGHTVRLIDALAVHSLGRPASSTARKHNPAAANFCVS
jgi:transposase